MTPRRLEAFSDGVLAIIITIMVLEMKPPHGTGFAELAPLRPVFLSYVLSFIYLAIYWNNHHHLMHAAEKVDGRILWANMNLLFWLSLIPFTTGWMGENHFAAAPTALYGLDLLMAAGSWLLLQQAIIRSHGCRNSTLARAVGRDAKGYASLALYAAALPTAFFSPHLSLAAYAGVALIWIVPDRRIAKALEEDDGRAG
jgi:uncharacterized membrane protein